MTLRIKRGFRLEATVGKKKRASSMANSTAPMVALIIRKGMTVPIVAKELVPGGGIGIDETLL